MCVCSDRLLLAPSQDHILTKCMIILRQDLVEERGVALLDKLSEIWTQFYTSILPTLLAMFAPIQVLGP